MSQFLPPLWFGVVLHLGLQAFFITRALLRPNREPASRIAWVLVILAAPVVGMIAYVLFGDATIGGRRIARLRAALDKCPPFRLTGQHEGEAGTSVPVHMVPLFEIGRSFNGFPMVRGNSATLLDEGDAPFDTLVADIDAAEHHVHLLFYIWMPDESGLKVVEAVKRAARRGVTVRAMADDLGSRLLIRSPHWQAMSEAGVNLQRALEVGLPVMRMMSGRIDMRNHRKIAVIDNRITYCGSKNCADAAFHTKARWAPWVDILLRFEGPVVRQNQYLFASDWMAQSDEDLTDLLNAPFGPVGPGFPAQVIASGAAVRPTATPEIIASLLFTARRELVVTTPYYVPDESIQAAFCATARRGVKTTLVLPQRNDSWIVAAASRSYYKQLLDAGVRIMEFTPGLLHAKTLTLDGEVALIGSTNLDRRSFELNFENNILLHDEDLTSRIRARQQSYIDRSEEVTQAHADAWSRRDRLWNNTVAMFGPVL